MSSKTYVTLPGHSNRADLLRWNAWLPNLAQVWAAFRFQVEDAVDPLERKQVTVTMRQGLGLVVMLGLLAGLIPMIANLWLAVPMGTAVPLAQLADASRASSAGIHGQRAPGHCRPHGADHRWPGT